MDILGRDDTRKLNSKLVYTNHRNNKENIIDFEYYSIFQLA